MRYGRISRVDRQKPNDNDKDWWIHCQDPRKRRILRDCQMSGVSASDDLSFAVKCAEADHAGNKE
jgi:hypothetical protein